MRKAVLAGVESFAVSLGIVAGCVAPYAVAALWEGWVGRVRRRAALGQPESDLYRRTREARVRIALYELFRRANDPDVQTRSRGAKVMLEAALRDAEKALRETGYML